MIEVENLSIHLGNFRLEDISFVVPTGAYAVLMGRTGSGKTTILEAIIGLRRPSAGVIRLGGVNVSSEKPAVRGIGYVPQDGALFNTMTVAEQMGLGLEVRRFSQVEVRQRVAELAELLGITSLLARYPHGLSGGERQRVALGRALAFSPRILCLDEPLSALDDETRLELIDLLQRVQQNTGVTTLHVTHNASEADRLAEVRLLLHEGKVLRQRKQSDFDQDAREINFAQQLGERPTE